MVIASLRVVAPPEKREDVLTTIRLLVGPTSVKPGCIKCRIYQDVEDANALTLVEEWESKKYLDSHIRSEDYRNILAVMDISIEPPEISFKTVSRSEGMDLIRAVRL